MKASELRIGNYILADTLDGLFMPHFVVGGDILAIQNDELPCETKPIPITPEILEKCGFEKIEYHPFWRLNQKSNTAIVYGCGRDGDGFPIVRDDSQYRKYFACEDDMYSWQGKEIKHLHQLQNLYFALTGEELAINL